MTTRAVSRPPASDAAERLRYLDDTAAPLSGRAHPGRVDVVPAVAPTCSSGRRPVCPARSCPPPTAGPPGPRSSHRAPARVPRAASSAGLSPWPRGGSCSLADAGLAAARPDAAVDRRPPLRRAWAGVVILSTPITGRRANRKPVLQLLDARGHTVAWAKIGVDALTSVLVKHEANVLASLCRRATWPCVCQRSSTSARGATSLCWCCRPLLRTGARSGRRLRAADRNALARSRADVGRRRVASYVETLHAQIDGLLVRVPPPDAVALAALRDVLADLRPALAAAVLPTATWRRRLDPVELCAAGRGDAGVGLGAVRRRRPARFRRGAPPHAEAPGRRARPPLARRPGTASRVAPSVLARGRCPPPRPA